MCSVPGSVRDSGNNSEKIKLLPFRVCVLVGRQTLNKERNEHRRIQVAWTDGLRFEQRSAAVVQAVPGLWE